jgi:hypothetical protein
MSIREKEQMRRVKCPRCPLCGSAPLYAWTGLVPWFCPAEDCDALAWDPFVTLEDNLMNAAKAAQLP